MRRRALALLSALTMGAGNPARADDPCNPPKEILIRRVVPPSDNPHPPASDADRARADLANAVVRTFYTTRLDEADLRARLEVPHDPALDDLRPGPEAFAFETKSAACLADTACWSKDYAFLRRIAGLASMHPAWRVSRVLWAHVAPWSLQPRDQVLVRGTRADYAHTSDPEAFVLSPPVLKTGERVVDAAVTLEGREGYWHLLIVVADDRTGAPGVRWFEMVPIQDLKRWSCNPR